MSWGECSDVVQWSSRSTIEGRNGKVWRAVDRAWRLWAGQQRNFQIAAVTAESSACRRAASQASLADSSGRLVHPPPAPAPARTPGALSTAKTKPSLLKCTSNRTAGITDSRPVLLTNHNVSRRSWKYNGAVTRQSCHSLRRFTFNLPSARAPAP